ncbi:pseudouridine synthase [Desulfoluna butyratoxydans]|uniref:Pseudouridine synthase n=1 Tax=Desulfoluna butyratoxydans TaxID=231438 RepID=A0A4U8YN91_9BACT|nr:pseudouridine synthase rsua/rlub/e/f [Desulfoluna butyratoxydans]
MTEIEGVRLQKYLAHAGVCSRRAAETLIKEGAVTVNDRVVTELGSRVDPAKDRVCVKGQAVRTEEKRVYLALHKPVGVITSCNHGDARVVTDLVDVPERVFPVGRLDRDSSGLLILTNDGRIHHRLSHPSFDHEKEYRVRVSAEISSSELSRMEKGIRLKEGMTRPCRIRREEKDRYTIVLKEGKNRQIRRMAQSVGHEVVTLKRVRMANIRLGQLKPGQWRHLSEGEVAELLKRTGVEAEKGRRRR